MLHHPAPRRALLLTALALTTTGCVTGSRPTLNEAVPITDDAARAVIERLDRAPTSDFTAVYEITPTSDTEATIATITRRGDEIRAEIGDVLFVTEGTRTTTCDAAGGDCDEFGNDARISNLGLTHRFWGPAFRQRLAVDTERRIGSSTGSLTTIAGQPATCAMIKIPSTQDAVGTVNYCALDAGILARYLGADATIELVSFGSGS